MKYKISEKECASKLGGRVCSQCGRPVEPIKTVDNSGDPTFWAGCLHCSKFDAGTLPEIRDIAVMMVDENHFRAYHHFDPPEDDDDREYQRLTQIGGTVSVVRQVLHIKQLIEATDA